MAEAGRPCEPSKSRVLHSPSGIGEGGGPERYRAQPLVRVDDDFTEPGRAHVPSFVPMALVRNLPWRRPPLPPMARRLTPMRYLAISILWLVTTAVPATALPILITSGSMQFPRFPYGTVELLGTDGFSYAGNISPSVNLGPRGSCFPCAFGAGSVSMDGQMIGLDVTGAVTVEDYAFRIGSGSSEYGSLSLALTGIAAVPTVVVPGTTFQVTVPFHMEGRLHLPISINRVGALPAYDLVGDGTATLFLTAADVFDDGPRWMYNGVRYDFARVPEPSALLLTVVGVGAAVLRRLRRCGGPIQHHVAREHLNDILPSPSCRGSNSVAAQ